MLRDMVLLPCCKKAEAQGACKQSFTDGSFKATDSVSSQVCLEKGSTGQAPALCGRPLPACWPCSLSTNLHPLT